MPLVTSPKPLSSKYSFGLVKLIQIEYFVIPTSPNHRNGLIGLVTQKVFGTDLRKILFFFFQYFNVWVKAHPSV